MSGTRAPRRFPWAFPSRVFCGRGSASQEHRNLPSKISKDACGCDAGSPLPTHRDLPSEQTASLLIATRTEMSASPERMGLPALGACSHWACFFEARLYRKPHVFSAFWESKERKPEELVVCTKGLAGVA